MPPTGWGGGDDDGREVALPGGEEEASGTSRRRHLVAERLVGSRGLGLCVRAAVPLQRGFILYRLSLFLVNIMSLPAGVALLEL